RSTSLDGTSSSTTVTGTSATACGSSSPWPATSDSAANVMTSAATATAPSSSRERMAGNGTGGRLAGGAGRRAAGQAVDRHGVVAALVGVEVPGRVPVLEHQARAGGVGVVVGEPVGGGELEPGDHPATRRQQRGAPLEDLPLRARADEDHHVAGHDHDV